MEMVRVTEAAALAASRWMGQGQGRGRRGSSRRHARRPRTVPMDGIVVIGEGEKDEAPMLFNGEEIGDGTPPQPTSPSIPSTGPRSPHWGGGNAWGSSPCPSGQPVQPRPVRLHGEDRRGSRGGGPHRPRRLHHREPEGRWPRPRRTPIRTTSGHPRPPRHEDIIGEVREGGRPNPAHPRRRRRRRHLHRYRVGRDILLGIGGTPEVIAAAALGAWVAVQGRLWPRNDEERQEALDQSTDRPILDTDDLVEGNLLRRYRDHRRRAAEGRPHDLSGASTQSLVMRSRSGTVRLIDALHKL